MMKIVKFVGLLLCTGALVACQSNKLPMPKGRWMAVNTVGFIPPNITKYSDEVKTLTQHNVFETQNTDVSDVENQAQIDSQAVEQVENGE